MNEQTKDNVLDNKVEKFQEMYSEILKETDEKKLVKLVADFIIKVSKESPNVKSSNEFLKSVQKGLKNSVLE